MRSRSSASWLLGSAMMIAMPEGPCGGGGGAAGGTLAVEYASGVSIGPDIDGDNLADVVVGEPATGYPIVGGRAYVYSWQQAMPMRTLVPVDGRNPATTN